VKNRNLQILSFALVVIMLGFGIIIPILPFYVEGFGGGGVAMGSLSLSQQNCEYGQRGLNNAGER